MKRNVAGVRWRAGSVALGVVLLFGSAAAFAGAAAQAAPAPVQGRAQRVGQTTDSLTQFARLMPVLTSPRCLNCHGGTDPVGGDNHGGGAVGQHAVCQDCHTASEDWQSVSGIKFATDVMPMCATMRHVLQVLGPSAFVNFLASDPVVGIGFDGLRGMDENSPFWPVDAEPPPIGRDQFVSLANAWVTQGKGKCGSGGWSGKINYTQTFSRVSSDDDAGRTTTIDIALVNGEATANVLDKTHEFSQTPPGPGCPVTRHNTGGASGQVTATVNVVPDGDDYQIFLSVPEVTGTENFDTLNVGGCKNGRVTGSEQYTVGAVYTIHGKVDQNDPNHLKGMSEIGTSFEKTTVLWDLNLEDD